MNGTRVPFANLQPCEDAVAVRAAIDRVLARGWFVLGPEVAAFETEFAAISGAAHAVGVGSGTDALALLLRALGIGAGDEVITTPLSAAFTALAIMMTGARPVFADIDPARLTLHPGAATEYLHELAEGSTLAFPAFDARGYVVWGMTHRILTGFLELYAQAVTP